jgi:hypothetical protein
MLMIYSRGKKVFRKFEEDNSGVAGGGIQPRVLFPSARGTRARGLHSTQEEGQSEDAKHGAEGLFTPEDEIDHFATISEASSGPRNSSETVTTTEETKAALKEEVEKSEITPLKGDYPEEEGDGTPSAKMGAGEENPEVEKNNMEDLPEKRTRAPPIAPSVSSVASSNILGFGRRPRITKSVSNLSNGEGKAPGLRRSKRLASVEPEQSSDIGKATIKQKLASKRGRTDDPAFQDTGKSMDVQGGTRKRAKH